MARRGSDRTSRGRSRSPAADAGGNAGGDAGAGAGRTQRPTLFDDDLAGPPSWRALLAGRSPREILARIVPQDPLGLRARVAARLAERAWLLAADRVHLRALARCARAAVHYRGRPALDVWLDALVDEAVLDLLAEDAEAAATGREPAHHEVEAFAALARPLGLDPLRMRAVCAAFNALPEEERTAFRALAIDGSDLDALARESASSASLVARRARRALEVLLRAERSRSTPPATRPTEEPIP